MACLGAVRTALESIEGVAHVSTLGRERRIDVRVRPGGGVDPATIADAIRSQGFTPEALEIRAPGRLLRVDGVLVFELSGTTLRYELAGKGVDEGLVGRDVVLHARLPPPYAPAKAKLRLLDDPR